MKRRWLVPCLLLLTGCSTYPLISVRDHFRPGRFGQDKVTPYGGVCIPQGPVDNDLLGIPGIPVPGPGGVIPPPLIGGGVIPPPAPLPPQGANPPIFPGG